MTRQAPTEAIERTLRGITIPSRPQILQKLDEEFKKKDPDPRVVARLIGGDVAVSAAVLKIVNSPFFGLSRKISSVDQAVSLLGMRTAAQVVTSLVLKSAVSGKTVSLERFWDSAEKVACIASYVAQSIPRGPRDDAYCFGLFHDVGIPLLLQKFPDYRQTLILAESSEQSLTALEEKRHATDHATLGYLVAKGWFLPEAICEGILYHHDPSIFAEKESIDPRSLTLVAINTLAEHFHDEYIRLRSNIAWATMGEQALAHLGLADGEYRDLREELTAMIR